MSARQKALKHSQILAARSAGTSNGSASGGSHTRKRAQITANNADGTYLVDIISATGVVLESGTLALSFPLVDSLAVDSYVWLDFEPGQTKGVIDATGGGGSGSGGSAEIIVVGAPGYLSGT